MIVKAWPNLETTNVPKNKFFLFFHWLVTRPLFDASIMVCIVGNVIQMSISFEDSTNFYNTVLEDLNYFFTCVFTFEMICKLIAFWHTYFKSNWNIFDFIVVNSSWVDIIFTLSTSGSSNSKIAIIKVLPQLARIMWVLWVSRLFWLI